MTGDEPRRSRPGLPSAATGEATELRWFADGPLPGSVRAWFAGPADAAEERCDRYLLDGAVDIGIKVRGGRTLELKARRGSGHASIWPRGPADASRSGANGRRPTTSSRCPAMHAGSASAR